MSGGEHAHVDRHSAGLAHRPHFPFLQHAQQLDLQFRRHVADLVEKHGAAFGGAEQAGMIGMRAGEGAAAMAEQFGLEQLGRHRGAVDGDERPSGAWTALVDGARQQLLAGAAGAGDEHGGLAARHAARVFQHRAHQRTAADDAATPVVRPG